MADQPAPSPLPTGTDSTLRAEFDSYMQGFALTLDPSTPSDVEQRNRRNAVAGARAVKVARSMADLGELLPVPTVASRPTGPLVGESMVFTYQPKPQPRRLIVAPKAKDDSELSMTLRMVNHLRAYRQMFGALFLSDQEAYEACPSLRPHMIPVVVVNP